MRQTHRRQEFQSTLPYGSDGLNANTVVKGIDFNPRSLTGATVMAALKVPDVIFQSTLPYGSDKRAREAGEIKSISIHAPLRERPCFIV